MTFCLLRRPLLPALTLAWACSAGAQPVPAADAGAAAQQTRPAARATGDAHPQLTVIEDDGVRIEETRLRGAAQRIVVQSKVPGAPAYEIQVAPAGRDPSQERGSAGRRTWSLLRF